MVYEEVGPFTELGPGRFDGLEGGGVGDCVGGAAGGEGVPLGEEV